MENVFVIAILITALYCITKFIEIRFLNQDVKPMKEIVREALLVLTSSITGSFLYFNFHGSITNFFNVVTETKVLNSATTQIFTDAPAF